MKIRSIISVIFLVVATNVYCQDYASLSKRLDGGYYKLASNILYFEIYGEYNGATLKFFIYDETNTVVASNSLNSTVINSTAMNAGNNLYSITCTSGSIFPTGYYVLEIINEKNEKVYLRFKK